MHERQVQSLDHEDPLQKERATHFSILSWETPWTEEPGRLQSMGWQRVGHNLVTKQASLIAQLIKNLPLIQETLVWFLGWEDLLEKEEATLKYSWASLVVQLVKNPPAMWETWVQSPGWEDPLEKERATSPIFWPGEFQGLYSLWVPKELDTTEQLSLLLSD